MATLDVLPRDCSASTKWCTPYYPSQQISPERITVLQVCTVAFDSEEGTSLTSGVSPPSCARMVLLMSWNLIDAAVKDGASPSCSLILGVAPTCSSFATTTTSSPGSTGVISMYASGTPLFPLHKSSMIRRLSLYHAHCCCRLLGMTPARPCLECLCLGQTVTRATEWHEYCHDGRRKDHSEFSESSRPPRRTTSFILPWQYSASSVNSSTTMRPSTLPRYLSLLHARSAIRVAALKCRLPLTQCPFLGATLQPSPPVHNNCLSPSTSNDYSTLQQVSFPE